MAMSTAGVVFTLVGADVALSQFTSMARDPMKVGLQTIREFGHSSDDGKQAPSMADAARSKSKLVIVASIT